MNLRYLFLLASLVFAIFVTIIGFGWWDDQLRHVWGWFGLSFACLIIALAPLTDRPLRT